MVGHGEKSCKAIIQISRGKQEHQYGPWMRANIGRGSPQKEHQNKYNSEKSYWGFKDGDMVLLNTKAKENMEHRHKDSMTGRHETLRQVNAESQTAKEGSRERGGHEAQKRSCGVSSNELNRQRSTPACSKSQKEKSTTEASGTPNGEKDNCELQGERISISEEQDINSIIKGDLDSKGLEQIASELMQVSVVEEGPGSPVIDVMHIDPGSSDLGTKAVQKYNSKMKKQLRSPKISRQPLRELSGNKMRTRQQGKRKINLVDEDMVEVHVNELVPKRNKMAVGGRHLSEELEGEGANLNWPLKLQ